jgi:NADPH2:quinone reductase
VSLGDTGDTVSRARAVNDGRDFSTVIEVTGLQQPLDIASQLADVRGTLVIAGYHQDGPRQVDLQHWNWRGIDVINAHERARAVYVRGLQDAVRLVEEGVLPLDRLITHVFPLDELDRAFRHAVDRPSGFLKAVVVNA